MSLAPGVRILIVLMGSLGDVVRGLSLLPRIRSVAPGTRITWLIEPKCAGIVEGHPLIDRVVVFRRGSGLRAVKMLRAELRREGYDLCLDLQRHLKSGFFAKLSGAKRRIGWSRGDSKEGNWLFSTERIAEVGDQLSKILVYHKFLDQLGLPPWDGRAAGLDHLRSELDRSAAPVVTLVLGSSWPSKNWLPAGYEGLVEIILARSQASVVLVGGPGERELGESIAQRFGSRVCSRAGATTLSELARIVGRSTVAAGPDSGPGHIAAALGVPYISLFGATDPSRVAPWGNEQRVVRSAVGCSPCGRRICPGLGTLCMRLIRPERVFEGIGRVLQHSLR